MSSSFPTALDSFTDEEDGVSYPTASDMNNIYDAIEKLEAKLGIDDSAVATSIDYIIKNKTWPIGSVFIGIVSTNPATLLGYGTWSQISQGRVLIGQNGADADFDVAEETGGAKTINIYHNHTGPSHTHTYSFTTSGGSGGTDVRYGTTGGYVVKTYDHTHTGSGTTSADGTGATSSSLSSAQSVMNPYFVVYIWKRTA